MIEFWVARAMQMAYLDEKQVERIHVVENRCTHPLANFNIQSILKIPTIKERWGIPTEKEPQALHADRIRMELVSKGFQKSESDGRLEALDLDAIHALDWTVLARGSEIIWDCVPSNSLAGEGGYKKRFKEMANL